jgi:molybdenum cofactor biosynthesis enzyme MoaA
MTSDNTLKMSIPYKLLRLSLSCNTNCLFCNVPKEAFPNHPDVSFAQAKKEINTLIKQDINTRLSITGGEPTLRNDLLDIIAWASQKGVKTLELQTNGILLVKKPYVKKLKKAGLTKIFVGLHAPVSSIHDLLVGTKGAFDACILGIMNALQYGLEVTLNPVLTTYNYKYFPAYLKFIKDKFPGIKCISLSVVQPRGRAWRNRSIVPRYGLLNTYVKKGLRAAKRYRITVNNPYCGLPLCIGGWHKYLDQCVEYCENLLLKKGAFSAQALDREKIKTRSCCSCRLSDYCNGVWKEYAYIHPLDDLIPIKQKK